MNQNQAEQLAKHIRDTAQVGSVFTMYNSEGDDQFLVMAYTVAQTAEGSWGDGKVYFDFRQWVDNHEEDGFPFLEHSLAEAVNRLDDAVEEDVGYELLKDAANRVIASWEQ